MAHQAYERDKSAQFARHGGDLEMAQSSFAVRFDLYIMSVKVAKFKVVQSWARRPQNLVYKQQTYQ